MFGMISMLRSQWTKLPIIPQDLTGQTFIVTGGNIGLGYEAAKHLVSLNASRVIIGSRSVQRGNDAKAAIDAATGRPAALEVWELDLASFASVGKFAARAASELARLDGLLLNASVALDKWSEAEGMETTVTVNIVGTFLLGLRLVPLMRKTHADHGVKPHLTVVSSGTGIYQDWMRKLDLKSDVFTQLNDKLKADMNSRYQTSKLLQMHASRQLAELLPIADNGIVVNYLDPGLCVTNLTRDVGWAGWMQVEVLRMVMARTAEQGSRTLLHAVVANPATHGMYCGDCEMIEQRLPAWMNRERSGEAQKKVWGDLAAILNKLEPGIVERALAA